MAKLKEHSVIMKSTGEETIATVNDLETKVDKVTGKGLSTEDYTAAEKTKLAGIEAGANKYVHPATHSAGIIVESSTKRFVSDTEKATWNAKETPTGAQAKVDVHANKTDNPHLVTKSQVGLGSVANYGIATQAEAQAGASNVKYMTPLRTREAIETLAGSGGGVEWVDVGDTVILEYLPEITVPDQISGYVQVLGVQLVKPGRYRFTAESRVAFSSNPGTIFVSSYLKNVEPITDLSWSKAMPRYTNEFISSSSSYVTFSLDTIVLPFGFIVGVWVKNRYQTYVRNMRVRCVVGTEPSPNIILS